MLKQFKPEVKIEVQKFRNGINSDETGNDGDSVTSIKKTEGCKCCEANSLAKKSK